MTFVENRSFAVARAGVGAVVADFPEDVLTSFDVCAALGWHILRTKSYDIREVYQGHISRAVILCRTRGFA